MKKEDKTKELARLKYLFLLPNKKNSIL